MTQIQEYLLPDGTYAQGRQHARLTSAIDLLAFAAPLVGPAIGTRYAVMTCVHEAGDRDQPLLGAAWNERDQEEDGLYYYGVAMISEAEARRFGYIGTDMHDPPKALVVLAALANEHLDPIIQCAHDAQARGLPFVIGDIPGYLAYAHNAGLGTARAPIPGHPQGALESIFVHGLDWTRFEGGNPTMPIVAHRYARDCIDGGKLWPLLAVT